MINNIYDLIEQNFEQQIEENNKYLIFEIQENIFAIDVFFIKKIVASNKISKISYNKDLNTIGFIKFEHQIIPIFNTIFQKIKDISQNISFLIIEIKESLYAIPTKKIIDIISINKENINTKSKITISSNIIINNSTFIDDKMVMIISEDNFS